VNTIKVDEGKLIGYNTDVHGFKVTLQSSVKPHHKNALILGTGGAAKAVAYVLTELGIDFQCVSRTKKPEVLTYSELDKDIMQQHTLIINATPIGMGNYQDEAPTLSYQHLTAQHFLYDLIYNPEETLFLQKGKEQGSGVKNGLDMLHAQAKEAWEIWNQ